MSVSGIKCHSDCTNKIQLTGRFIVTCMFNGSKDLISQLLHHRKGISGKLTMKQ